MNTKASADTFRRIDTVSSVRSQSMATLPMDHHVGSRIRLRRVEIGMSAENLAQRLGATRQMVEKYERGVTRITCGKLYDIALILNIHPSYFMDSFASGPTITGTSAVTSIVPAMMEIGVLWDRMAPEHRKAVKQIMERLAPLEAPASEGEAENE